MSAPAEFVLFQQLVADPDLSGRRAARSKLIVCDTFIIREGVKDLDGNGGKHEWPRGGGTIEKNRSVRHSVHLSISEGHARVKLLEEISLPSLLKRNFSSTTGRMNPAGFEPASATVTECRVPLTRRALIGVFRNGWGYSKVGRAVIFGSAPNWELFNRHAP